MKAFLCAGATRPAVLLLAMATVGCQPSAPAACQDVADVTGQMASLAGQQVTVCGYVNGAARSTLVLTQASEPAPSLRLVIDPAAAEQPDIAALLRSVDGRTRDGGSGAISARVTGVLAAPSSPPGSAEAAAEPVLKVLSVADVEAK